MTEVLRLKDLSDACEKMDMLIMSIDKMNEKTIKEALEDYRDALMELDNCGGDNDFEEEDE